MELIVRETEGRFERLGQRAPEQGPTVVPASLVPAGLHPGPGQFGGEPEPMEEARGVGTDLDAGPTSPSAAACS